MSKVGKTKETVRKCVCAKCPSFLNAVRLHPELKAPAIGPGEDVAKWTHPEAMYCAFGKSRKIEEKKGCSCFRCKNFQEHALTDGFFCLCDEL